MNEEFYIAALRHPEDVDFAGKLWHYGKLRYDGNLLETLRYLVKQGCPTFGVYTKKDNKLVSWLMTDIDQVIMNAHTIDEYRGRGAYTWNMLHLLNKKEFEKWPKYVYIPESNKTSVRHAEFLGAKFYSKRCCNFVIKAKVTANQ